MLVICEDCAKKYTIDEKRIKAAKAKFSCRACGHIIVVEKPKLDIFQGPSEKKIPVGDPQKGRSARSGKISIHETGATASSSTKRWSRPVAFYLMLTMLIGFLAVSGTFTLFYFKYIQNATDQQMELHSLALAISLQKTIQIPLQNNDYLQVNQKTKQMGKLPGVAYAAVLNDKRVVVAGFFNTPNAFDNHFIQKVKEKGFPVDILAKSGLGEGETQGGARINVGGLSVFDRVLSIPEGQGEVHVGIYTTDTKHTMRNAFLSPLFFLPAGLALLFCYLVLFLVDGLITRPMRSLTSIANRISLGELDLAITPDGSREIHDLGTALTRMRHSIKITMEKMTKY
ncbi:MAG: HAMP domain-containing protein [Candidatus Electrothrix sp. AR3]|nr:HAMP domain-containing protein [Candidatus Electrothrix sp. AR3]